MFFSTAGTIAGTHTQVANTPEFQTWIAGRCDTVAKLAHAGYPITAIVKMFRENMNERLMISSTWFRRQPITDSLDFFIRVWVDPNNHAKGTIHGGLTANGARLAVRHLYENFIFDLPDSIKAQNSFHPKDTKVNDLVCSWPKAVYSGSETSALRTLVGTGHATHSWWEKLIR
jgi:hypothetical protein